MKPLCRPTTTRRLGQMVAAAAISAAMLTGCSDYDAPPEPSLVRPEGGAFVEGETIQINFSDTVVPETLGVRIWPNQRGPEGDFPDDVDPLVPICRPSQSPCGDLTVTVNDDHRQAELSLGGALGEAGRPLLIEVNSGLADPLGNDTGISYFYDIQFRSENTSNGDPIVFDNGIYMLGATVQEPIPAVLTLISDIRISEDGTFALAGTSGKVTDDDAPKDTLDPDKISLKTGDKSWTVYARGTVTVDDDGKRLLETDAFDVFVPLGLLDVRLNGMRMFATIKKDPATSKDYFEGTLSYDEVVLITDDDQTTSEGSSTSFRANYIPEAKIPAGHAELCGDLCGDVAGHCEPPEDFPPAAVCPDP